jgi:hypothetical protein
VKLLKRLTPPVRRPNAKPPRSKKAVCKARVAAAEAGTQTENIGANNERKHERKRKKPHSKMLRNPIRLIGRVGGVGMVGMIRVVRSIKVRVIPQG